jgi:hypothetical protein
MANLTALTANDVQPWDAYQVRDEHGHPLQEGRPIGSRVHHPRRRLVNPTSFCMVPDGATYGRCWSYALACQIS